MSIDDVFFSFARDNYTSERLLKCRETLIILCSHVIRDSYSQHEHF